MATTVYANNVGAVTAADIGPSDTLLILSAGQGATFPSLSASEYMWATLIHPVSHVTEIVKITARSGDTLTIERGRDGSAATAFPAGSVIEMRVVAELLRELSWRLVANAANGVLQLGTDAKAAKAQLPADILYSVAGLLPADKLPAEAVTESEGDARYARLASPNTFAENATFSKTVNVLGDMQVGIDTGVLGIGNDAYFLDVGIANTISVRGRQDPNQGFIMFGASGKVGWVPGNGSITFEGPGVPQSALWHSSNFDPAQKVDVYSGGLNSPKIFRSGFPQSHGIAYWGNGNNYILFDTANFICSNNFYAPNIIAQCDARLKKSIRVQKAVRNIGDRVELHSWEWRKKRMPHGPAGRHTGPLAQAVLTYAPHHVTELEDGTLGVDKAGLALEVGVDSAARIRALEARVEELSLLVYKLTKNR